jgi:tetratricopeptide (TPR) repeat protein
MDEILSSRMNELLQQGAKYEADDDWENAIKTYTELIQQDNQYIKGYWMLSYSYANRREYDNAISTLDKALQLDPNFVGAYDLRGTMYMLKDDYEKGFADANMVIQLKPDSPSAYARRGSYYATLNNPEYELAIADYTKAIQLGSVSIVYRVRGKLYEKTGNLKNAIADYETYLELESVTKPNESSRRTLKEEINNLKQNLSAKS